MVYRYPSAELGALETRRWPWTETSHRSGRRIAREQYFKFRWLCRL
jgi:hypothetical protein